MWLCSKEETNVLTLKQVAWQLIFISGRTILALPSKGLRHWVHRSFSCTILFDRNVRISTGNHHIVCFFPQMYISSFQIEIHSQHQFYTTTETTILKRRAFYIFLSSVFNPEPHRASINGMVAKKICWKWRFLVQLFVLQLWLGIRKVSHFYLSDLTEELLV